MRLSRLAAPLTSLAKPTEADSGRAVAARTVALLLPAVVAANLVGALVVFVFATWVVPTPPLDDLDTVRLANLIAFGAYLMAALPVGIVWGLLRFRPTRWFGRKDLPDEHTSRLILRGPLRLVSIHAVLWGAAVVAFTVLNLTYSFLLGLSVGITVLLGGMTTCAVIYLVSERLLRGSFRLALAVHVPAEPELPGVSARAMLAWALGSGVPVLGLALVAVAALAGPGVSRTQLATTILALGGVVLVIGLLATYLATKATADPVIGVRDALRRVERGELDVEVPVYDGTEVGLLQAGFNRMVAGVREREHLRDLFGRHVGEDVARAALEQGVELGGEERDVAALFVDVVGSTSLAAERSPTEVVDLLNALFGVVIDVVAENGGFVNKFEGDAVLAVFGAPVERDDAAGRALRAARELSRRLKEEVPNLSAGIGVSAGRAVAGNIGEERRFEYTVIGDPVNEAARLSELAKSTDEGVRASAAVVEAASQDEAEQWRLDDAVTLRGRSSETRLAVPVAQGAPV